VVGRCAIDDDYLDGGLAIGLRESAVDRLGDEVRVVERRDDAADLRPISALG